MIVLGLTGSIGMGKTTTAAFFREAGFPVWNADDCVNRLYAEGGAGVPAVAGLIPGVVRGGRVDRDLLRRAVLNDPGLLRRLEGIIHPLVYLDRMEFVEACRRTGERLVVCDVPLLFESGSPELYDRIVVVTASPEIQRERVLARPGMTEAAFAAILARQLPDEEKRARADYVIDTSQGMDAARAQVRAVITDLLGEGWDA
ncbi:MAG: dephospho-CoA kinase [Alphaproteobacteria bacterium]|nr:MAG: dephospho-CoA kinase [Alphaproteobacteria bacterium]